MAELKRTPLFPLYREYGAKVIDFGGWELPVQFSSILQEHEVVRTQAGLFDVSHMGEVMIEGPDALAFVQKITTNDASKLVIGQAQYSLMCYPDGGVVDDLLVYRLAEESFMLVINAANINKDVEWLRRHVEGNLSIRDISQEICLLALQGPSAEKILQELMVEPLASLKSFHVLQNVALNTGGAATGTSADCATDASADVTINAHISRSGYTGEDGFELYVSNEQVQQLWRMLIEVGQPFGLLPVGLGARDTLRFEARLPLYGQELSATISPLEAGLGFFVKLDKGDFIGREALQQQKVQGPARKLVGIEMIDRGIPRSHYPVYATASDETGGDRIGEVTTGTQSPTLKKNVGLALVDTTYSALGTELYVEIRGKKLRAQVVPTPFYKRP